MLAIEITLNLYFLAGIIIFCAAIGFLIRGGHLSSLKRKVLELETEMLSNHADILELQKEKATLEQQIKQSKIPVIPINAGKEEQDGLRKKMVANQGLQTKG